MTLIDPMKQVSHEHGMVSKMGEFKVGDHVEITGKDLKGEISFIGTTEFAQGKWIGKS